MNFRESRGPYSRSRGEGFLEKAGPAATGRKRTGEGVKTV